MKADSGKADLSKANLSNADQWATVADGWSAGLQSIFGTTAGAAAPGKSEGRKVLGMDLTWVTGRIAVGGGIWNAENMAAVMRAGVTHIIDMQLEFDDTELAKPFEIEVLWNPIDDDFQPKRAEVFERGVGFAGRALDGDGQRLLVHCAAGVHRAPMMALAILGTMGWKLQDAMDLIEARRPVVDFAEVYVRSVENFLAQRLTER
jgi:protein-tyrosine phosphatase